MTTATGTATRVKLVAVYSLLFSIVLLVLAFNLLNNGYIYRNFGILSEEQAQTKVQLGNSSSGNAIEIQVKSDDSTDKQITESTETSVHDVEYYYQNISVCDCSRKRMYPPLFEEGTVISNFSSIQSLNSSCSDEGTFYQPNQNVVSFSLYLESSTAQQKVAYFQGLLLNLNMMRKYYAGYSLRLYTNIPLSPEYCYLVCSNQDLFWCYVRFTPSHGDLSNMVFRTWRFLPLGDPTVDIFLPRDLDSLISLREAAVVEDWIIKGDKSIFLMRDKNGSHDVAILAGMWGASNNMLGADVARKLMAGIIEFSKLKISHTYKSSDQEALKQFIFHGRRNSIVAYDSYTCVRWARFTEVRPFPMERQDPTVDFVGNIISFKGADGGMVRHRYKAVECPVSCRPEYGKDWTYC